MSLPFLCSLLLFNFEQIMALSLISTGGTLMLGNIPYYVPATPFTTISTSGFGRLQSVNGLAPVTVISITAANNSIGHLSSIIGDFAADDVWNTGFLDGRTPLACTVF